MEPRLPPELERAIFELSALDDISTTKTLLLVATRVQEWYAKKIDNYRNICLIVSINRIEPSLYRVLIYYMTPRATPRTQPLVDFIDKRAGPEAEITPHFRRVCSYAHKVLLQGVSAQSVKKLLSLLTDVRELAIWIMGDSYDDLRELIPSTGAPVTRLSINTTLLFGGPLAETFKFNFATLENITHLDAIAISESFWREEWRNFGLLPNLTHLAFVHDGDLSKHMVDSILTDQQGFKKLKFLVVFVTGDLHNYADESNLYPENAHDKRYVEIENLSNPIQEWYYGIRTGSDMWARAERREFPEPEGCGHLDDDG